MVRSQKDGYYKLLFVKFFLFLLFLLSPLFSIINLAFKRPVDKKLALSVLPLSMAVFLATLNSTKRLDSDLYNYSAAYELTQQSSFGDGLLLWVREPFYGLLTYISSKIGLSFSLYIFFLTLFTYLMLFVVVKVLIDSDYVDKYRNAWAYILVAFMPLIFSLSGHLIRQHISICVILFSIACYQRKYLKTSLALGLMAVLTHSSTIIFLFGIGLIYALSRKHVKFVLFSLSVVGFALLFIPEFFYIVLSDNIIDRLNGAQADIGSFNFVHLSISLITVLLCIFQFKFFRVHLQIFVPVVLLNNLVIYISIMSFDNIETAIRFAFNNYYFLVFLVVGLLMERVNVIVGKVSIFFSVPIFLILTFNSVWVYSAGWNNLLFNTSFFVVPFYSNVF